MGIVKFDLNSRRGGARLEPLLKQMEEIFSKDFTEPTNISLAVVNEETGKKLNRIYRGKDEATDILTFVYGDREMAGDIILCHKKVGERAKKEHRKIQETFAHLIIHGVCHILGYTHKNKKTAAQMEKREQRAMEKLRMNPLN
jgi:probable rRNA maturation factor